MTDTIDGTMLWRRLDTPGHDACALVRMDDDLALVRAPAEGFSMP